MTNFIYNTEPDTKELSLREKQCKCPHYSFKCPLCGLYKDNLFERNRYKIELLESLLEINEEILTGHKIGYMSIKDLNIDGIIDNMIATKKRLFHKQD